MSGLVPGRDFLMMMIMEVFLKQGKRIGISIKLNLKVFFGKWEGWYFFILSRFRFHDHDDSIRCLGIFCTGFWCRFFFVCSMTSRDCLAQFEKVTFALTRRSSASFLGGGKSREKGQCKKNLDFCECEYFAF